MKLFGEVQKILPPGAILASNTSTISITRMAAVGGGPERFAGLHFFNPVDRMQLVEVIRGEKTSDETVVDAGRPGQADRQDADRGARLPRLPGQSHPVPVHQRVAGAAGGRRAAAALDKAATAFGMPMGPITLNDVVGLDTSLYAGRVINTAFADRAVPTRILDELVAAGRLGQKIGRRLLHLRQGRQGGRRSGAGGHPGEVPSRRAAGGSGRRGDHGSAVPADADRGERGFWPRASSASRATWTWG